MHRWNRTVTRRKLILEIILFHYKLPRNHSLADFDEEYPQDDFYLLFLAEAKFNANRISRSKLASFLDFNEIFR